MDSKSKHSPVIFGFSKHNNIWGFWLKKQANNIFKKYENDFKMIIL